MGSPVASTVRVTVLQAGPTQKWVLEEACSSLSLATPSHGRCLQQRIRTPPIGPISSVQISCRPGFFWALWPYPSDIVSSSLIGKKKIRQLSHFGQHPKPSTKSLIFTSRPNYFPPSSSRAKLHHHNPARRHHRDHRQRTSSIIGQNAISPPSSGICSRDSVFPLGSRSSFIFPWVFGKKILMPDCKNKEVIGLSWDPKLPSFPAAATSSKLTIEASSSAYIPNSELVDGLYVPPNDPKKLNKLLKKKVKDTAGKNWFDMPAPTITPELKKDLQLLKLRHVIDPKRHYKRGDSKSKVLPKYFQVGTVIEPATEFYSGRLSKKERKATLADELLSDPNLSRYRKRKVREIEEQNRPAGVDKWKIRGQQSKKRAKQRRH